MALRTRRELVSDVLSQLRIIAADETPTHSDFDLVLGGYSDLHDELKDAGLCYWQNTGNDVQEIPGAVFRALSCILADDVSDTFGKDAPKVQENDGQVLNGRPSGMRQLRRHMAKKPSGESTPFSVF